MFLENCTEERRKDLPLYFERVNLTSALMDKIKVMRENLDMYFGIGLKRIASTTRFIRS